MTAIDGVTLDEELEGVTLDPEPAPDGVTIDADAPGQPAGEWTPTPLRDSPVIDGMQLVPLVPNEDDEAAKDEAVRTIYDTAQRDNPEQELEAFELAQLSGARIDDVKARIDDFRRTYKGPEFDARKWRYENPELAAIILEHPQLRPVVDAKDNWLKRAWRTLTSVYEATDPGADIMPLDVQRDPERRRKWAEEQTAKDMAGIDKIQTATSKRQDKSDLSTSEAALDAAAYTAKQQAIALQGMTLMTMDLWDASSPAAREKRESILRQQQELGEPGYYGEGAGRAIATTAAESIGNQASSIASLGAAALVGSATKSPATAVGAAKILTAATSFPVETGGAYLEFLRTRDENGNLMDPRVAAGAATLYGVIAATIETGLMDVRLAGFAGFKEAVKQGTGRTWLKEAVQSRTIRDRLMALGKQLGGQAGEEAKQEGLQQAWQTVTRWAGSSISAGEAQDFDATSAAEEVAGAALQGGVGGVVGLGGAQSLANTAHAIINISASRKDGRKIAVITQLAADPETKAAPRQVAKVIELATQQDEKVTHVYVDPKRFVEEVQKGGGSATEVDAAASALMGEQGPQRLRDALAVSGDSLGTRAVLEVPLTEYLERWGGTELAQALAEDVAVQPGRETLREQRLFQGGVKRIAQQLADEEERLSQGEAPSPEALPVSEAERRWTDTLQRQLVDSGREPSEARQEVALNRALYRTLAERFGRPIEEILPDLTVQPAGAAMPVEGALTQPSLPEELLPASLPVVRKDYDAQEQGEQKQRYFRDRNTRLRNFRALEQAAPDQGRPMLALFSPEGSKFFNDRFGHHSVDGALRTMADALRTVEGETGAKVGSDIGAWVRDEAHAEQIAAAMRAAMPEGVQVTYAVGPRQADLRKTIDTVADAHKASRLAAVRERTLGGRSGAPAAFLQGEPELALEDGMTGLAPDSPEAQAILSRAAERAAPVAESLRGAAAPTNETVLSPELEQAFADDPETFETIHLDKSGLLSDDGFAQARALNPKPFYMSADLRGFGGLNKAFGRAGTDAIKAWFSRALAEDGAGRFDTANLHGDEYAAQGDNEQEMREFFESQQRAMERAIFWDENEDGTFSMQAGLYFAYGIDPDEDTADRVRLKAAKDQQDAEQSVRGTERIASREELDARIAEYARARNLPRVVSIRVADLVRERSAADSGRKGKRAQALDALADSAVERLKQPAWHGTPHRGIERFSLDKIGSGQGAQAYGWGLYFASRQDVADYYRRTLSGITIDGVDADRWSDERAASSPVDVAIVASLSIAHEKAGASVEDAVAEVRRELTAAIEKDPHRARVDTRLAEEKLRRLDAFLSEHRLEAQRGQLHKVEVPDDAELLDRDAMLGDQPEAVRSKLKAAGLWPEYRVVKTDTEYFPWSVRMLLGGDLQLVENEVHSEENAAAMAERLNGAPNVTGAYLYDLIARAQKKKGAERPDKAASEALGAAGIPGLRFIGGGNTGNAPNYVIWDESRVSIEETLYQPRIRSPGAAFDSVMAESFPDRQNPVSAIEDARYLQWKGDKKGHEKPGPYGGPDDGTFDAVNEHLQLKGDKKVSGAREAWDKLWNAEKGPWGQRLRAVVDIMRQVPGFEELRLPDEFIADDIESAVAAQEEPPSDQPRGWIDIARKGSRTQFRVFLTHNSDRSTFLHESAHAYFEMLADLSEHADAPPQMRRDWQAVLDWLGAKDRKSLTVEHKEKFARGFEAYLMEGKAPSSALAEAFATFRLWLKHIYVNIRALGVKLSPDIREVFGRMLATDAEIERAQSAIGVDKPMSSEVLGMTGPEHEAYLKKRVEEASAATMRMQKAYADADLRTLKAYKTAEFRRLKAQAQDEWDRRPDVRAWRYVQRGETLVDGKPFQSTDIGRMDKYEVGRIVGPHSKIHKKLGGRLIANGESPSTIADGFGFKSAKAMLTALAALPDEATWVRERAEYLMKEAHPEIEGDIANAQAFAEDVVHKGSLDTLLMEWRALSKRAGSGEDTPLEAVKFAAADLVKRRYTAGRLDPGTVLQRERANANEAAIAAAKGNFKQAIAYKRLQVLHHFMWRELRQAVEDRDAFQDLAAKMGSKKQQERLARAGRPYRDVTNSILEAIGMAEKEELLEPRQGIGQLEQVMAENSDAVVFDVDVINTLLVRPRNWRELTLEEMREVTLALKNIRKGATNRNTVIEGDRRIDFEDAKLQLVDAIENSALTKRAPEKEAAFKGTWERAQALVEAGDASLLKPEEMLQFIGGEQVDSAPFRLIIKPLQEAKYRQADLYARHIRPIIAALDRVPKGVRGRFMEAIDPKEFFPNHREDIAPPTTRLQLLMMVPHRGNFSNLERMTRGRGITVAQLDKAISTLTKEELEWMQSVVDATETLWPLIKELEERDTGVAPTKIKAAPYAVTLADGTVVKMAGGYFPAVYVPGTRAGEQQLASAVAGLFDKTLVRPGTQRGHTKERAEEYAEAMSLDPGIVQSHFMKVTHDIAYREALRSVGRLMLDQDVQRALARRLGAERAKVFHQWLRDIGHMDSAETDPHLGFVARTLRESKNRLVVGTLGYAIDNFAADTTAVLTAAIGTDLKARYIASSLKAYAVGYNEVRKQALEKSGELRHRAQEVKHEVQRQMSGLTKNRPGRALAWYRDNAFGMAEAIDAHTSTIIWHARYAQGLHQGETEEQAVDAANRVVRQTLPSSSVVDKSAIQRSKHGFVGMTVAFYGYFNVVYQTQRRALQGVFNADGAGAKTASFAKALPSLFALTFVTSVLAEFIAGRGPEDDDGEDEAERYMNWAKRKMLVGALSGIPLVGSVVESWVMGKNPSPRAAPAFAALDAAGRAAAKAWGAETAEDGEKAAWAALRASGLLFGLPTRPMRWAEGLLDAASDDGTGNVPSDVVYGERRGNPRNPLNATEKLLE